MPRIERVETLDDREYQGGAEDGREVEATETREFTVGGQTYRTYLSGHNAEEFDADLAKWTEFAEKLEEDPSVLSRPARRKSPSAAGTGPRRDRDESMRVREWAKGQQFTPPVSDRGRIPGHVYDAYYAAHPDQVRPTAA